jgi:hypothetical protein
MVAGRRHTPDHRCGVPKWCIRRRCRGKERRPFTKLLPVLLARVQPPRAVATVVVVVVVAKCLLPRNAKQEAGVVVSAKPWTTFVAILLESWGVIINVTIVTNTSNHNHQSIARDDGLRDE